jgi:hypothetical protein
MGTIHHLPPNIVVTDDLRFSTLIAPFSETVSAREWAEEQLPGAERPVKYQVIRFKPTGGTDLNTIKYDSDPPQGTM